ncbi:hypothetical protein L3Q82_024120 [Scortum barcoo]|uniref:Uncharacterized protein n=1 Tax=Scortum barcoo TaxID=214431 RepID=A0ACB8WVG0_9TELE|nr:hypothetical protein L3Q82_024120 [Scortum barcoo]
MLWKTSCLVPVPKKSRPSDPADYRPVALTSHVMKVLERLVLAQLRPQVRKFLDPLQFAYQPHLGVDDAVIYLLQRAHMHLDGGGGTVRITFFDFSSAFNTIQPLLLGHSHYGSGGEVVEEVEDYKYLGVVIDNRLDWKSNTEAVYKKGMSRLYFLRKLRSFNVGSRMLEIFYQSVVASAIFFAAVCWGSSIRAGDNNRLDKIIKKAGSVLGLRLESFETVVERRMLNRLLSIMDNDQHPLHHTVDRQQEYLLSQAAPAPLSKGQIQEIFPATCPLTVQ